MPPADPALVRARARATLELLLPRTLCRVALPFLEEPAPEAAELRRGVLEHIEKTAQLAREKPRQGVDLAMARQVGDRCLDLCDALEQEQEQEQGSEAESDPVESALRRALVVVAVRYFVSADDLEFDGGFGGFDDDALVVEAVASELGLEEAGESW